MKHKQASVFECVHTVHVMHGVPCVIDDASVPVVTISAVSFVFQVLRTVSQQR